MRTIELVARASLLGALLPTPGAAQDGGAARVVLPLERYEELRPVPQKPAKSLTVLDSMRFGGAFQGGALVVTIDIGQIWSIPTCGPPIPSAALPRKK